MPILLTTADKLFKGMIVALDTGDYEPFAITATTPRHHCQSEPCNPRPLPPTRPVPSGTRHFPVRDHWSTPFPLSVELDDKQETAGQQPKVAGDPLRAAVNPLR